MYSRISFKGVFNAFKGKLKLTDVVISVLFWIQHNDFVQNKTKLIAVAIVLFLCLCSDHWDYHAHPHVHPVEFENLQETNFTELQSVQTLHAPSLLRQDAIRYEAEHLLDPNLGAHSHVLQQPVGPSFIHETGDC